MFGDEIVNGVNLISGPFPADPFTIRNDAQPERPVSGRVAPGRLREERGPNGSKLGSQVAWLHPVIARKLNVVAVAIDPAQDEVPLLVHMNRVADSPVQWQGERACSEVW
jgi:hypothetical protein